MYEYVNFIIVCNTQKRLTLKLLINQRKFLQCVLQTFKVGRRKWNEIGYIYSLSHYYEVES